MKTINKGHFERVFKPTFHLEWTKAFLSDFDLNFFTLIKHLRIELGYLVLGYIDSMPLEVLQY